MIITCRRRFYLIAVTAIGVLWVSEWKWITRYAAELEKNDIVASPVRVQGGLSEPLLKHEAHERLRRIMRDKSWFLNKPAKARGFYAFSKPLFNSSNYTKYPPLQCSQYMQIPDVSIMGPDLYRSSSFKSNNWGNLLSLYWAARAIAELGGYEFHGYKLGRETWMEYLPTHVAARKPRPEVFQRACACPHMQFFSRCIYGWSEIAQTILNDTRSAIYKYAEKRPQQERDKVFGVFESDSWVIYDRCQIFGHSLFGFTTLRAYDVIPSSGNFTIYAISGRREDPFNYTDDLHNERDKYLKSRNPNVNIVRLPREEQWVDFARLVFAPNLFIASAGSSWALWAVLANSGNIVTVPHLKIGMNHSVYPANVHVLANATILSPPHLRGESEEVKNKSIAETLSLLGPQFKEASFLASRQGREIVLRCYREC